MEAVSTIFKQILYASASPEALSNVWNLFRISHP